MAESEGTAVAEGNADAKSSPWYLEQLSLSKPARTLLEEYSHIPSEEVEEHVKAMFPYPCIGAFRFLNLSIINTPYYGEVLERIKSGEKFLDLGCCFGQELRQLAFDGAPTENLYGSDLRLDFISLGYDLFLDKDRLKAHFIAADIFDDGSDLVKQLSGKMDIIYTGSFFHLFGLEDQQKIAKRVVTLLKDKPNTLILGRQVGNLKPGNYQRLSGHGLRYRHDENTWTKLWEKVGEETGTKWKVEASLKEEIQGIERRFQEPDTKILKFEVRRV